MSLTDLDDSQTPIVTVKAASPWKPVVLWMGALPTLRMKQVEQASLGTRPQGVIMADYEIQPERDV